MLTTTHDSVPKRSNCQESGKGRKGPILVEFRARALGLLAWQDRSKMIPTDLRPWPCLLTSEQRYKGTPSITDKLQLSPDFFVDSITRRLYNCVVALLVIGQNESVTAKWRITLSYERNILL